MSWNAAIEYAAVSAKGMSPHVNPIVGWLILCILAGMVTVWAGGSFAASLTVPPLVLNVVWKFGSFVLSILLLIWATFCAAFRCLVAVFDMIFSLVDINVGRNFDKYCEKYPWLTASGVTKMAYPYHDYTTEEKRERELEEEQAAAAMKLKRVNPKQMK